MPEEHIKCPCQLAREFSDTNTKEPYRKIFEPFDRMVIQIAISRNKPRLWYSYNAKSGDREERLVSFERVLYKGNDNLKAYRFVIGALAITVGW